MSERTELTPGTPTENEEAIRDSLLDELPERVLPSEIAEHNRRIWQQEHEQLHAEHD